MPHIGGLTAFGGRLFDVDGSLDITNGGFGEWLNWLQKVRDQPGLILTRNQAEAQDLFSQGQAAYFVGERRQLNEMTAGAAWREPRARCPITSWTRRVIRTDSRCARFYGQSEFL